MFTAIRHSTRRYRAWFITLAAILLVTTILEAGHAHGVFAAEDDHCALCQHAFAQNKILTDSPDFIFPLVLCILVGLIYNQLIPATKLQLASIRAPPQHPQHP